MKIIYYIRSNKSNKLIESVNDAAIVGLENLGVDFKIKKEEKPEESDLAIIFGYYKFVSPTGRKRKKVYDLSKNVIVLERGYLDRENYHSAGLNGLNGRGDYKNKNSSDDRFKELKIDVEKWRDGGTSVLVCGQVPWDSNVQHLNKGLKPLKRKESVSGYLGWLEKTIRKIRDNTDRPIVFRPHPLFTHKEWYRDSLDKDVIWSEKPFEQDLENAFVCVAFNSNCLVDAILKGVPIFSFDEGSMVYDISNKSLKRINKPKKYSRTQYLNNLAYTQWNLQELAEGKYFRHLIR